MQRAGAGLLFNPALADYVARPEAAIDHLATIPDRCWVDHGPQAGAARFETLRAPTEMIEDAAHRVPVVLHAIGLSICSADDLDHAYVEQLARWRERLRCAWVSEHLSFTRGGGEHEVNAALALASPYDDELLALVVPRVRAVQSLLGVPLLLENAVNYLDYGDEDMSEVQFLNRLVAETGCGLLLDLHNLYTNATNHHFDAHAYLRALNTAAVREVHVAGGDTMRGFHTDSHAGPVHQAVWPLLDDLLPRAPALQAVTFEFHEASWPLLHADGLDAQLRRMRAAIKRNADQQAEQETEQRTERHLERNSKPNREHHHVTA